MWGTTPDDRLLDAADAGELDDPATRDEVLDRMLADPRVEDGLRAFLADLFEIDALETAEKDPTLYPGFDAMRGSMREQWIETAVYALERGGYPALFTTRTTFVDAPLASMYGLDPATLTGSTRVELAPDGPRAGVLTLPGFLAIHAYPGKTSPALRGLFVRKRLLCQDIPPPPADVDTRLPEVEEGVLVTTRELVASHQREPSCAGCHSFMDPIGLGLEHFDAIGAYRELENELPIDPSGVLDGTEFDDAVGLGEAIAAHPRLMPCMTARTVAFAVGATIDATEPEITALAAGGSDDVLALLRRVARSRVMREAFRADEEGVMP